MDLILLLLRRKCATRTFKLHMCCAHINFIFACIMKRLL